MVHGKQQQQDISIHMLARLTPTRGQGINFVKNEPELTKIINKTIFCGYSFRFILDFFAREIKRRLPQLRIIKIPLYMYALGQ